MANMMYLALTLVICAGLVFGEVSQDKRGSESCEWAGRIYRVGERFIPIDCSGRCQCRSGGRVSCVGLCGLHWVTCRPGQIKKKKNVYISSKSDCFCVKEYCA